jgi:hypothetical protein
MNYLNINGQAAKARRLLFGAAIWLILCSASPAWAQTTAFSYQGRLTDGGNPANNSYDLEFKLFDALAGGAQQGQTLTRNPVSASAGVFTVTLDFGANVFSGAARYLEIGVRPAGSGIAYTVLAPRQPITASPYAIQTLNAQQLGGLPPSRFVQTDATGNVGIGLTIPTTKLQVLQTTPGTTAIYAESATGRGIWGKSVSSKGVYGESTSLEGVQGVSSSGSGVAGVSTSGVGLLGLSASGAGVYGESAAVNTLTAAGVYGKALGVGGTGVYALSVGSGGIGLYGESATGRGVWGKSVSSKGVYGESVSLEGVQGVSNSGSGVAGVSTSGLGVLGISTTGSGLRGQSASGSGVYGESAVSSLTAGGVYGKGTGSGSIGVIGEANVNNAVGVYGVSSSPGGFGVYARNLAGGRAIFAEGNVAQDLSSNGMVKAMISVNRSGGIGSCYNAITNSSSGNCGFVITQPLGDVGVYRINYGFPVANRFVSITCRYFDNGRYGPFIYNLGANYRPFDNTSIEVFVFSADDAQDTLPNGFVIILY